MKTVKQVSTIIDGINLNSRHFAAMQKDEAVKRIIADGITTDEKWAAKAYDEMVANVKKADAPPTAVAPSK